MIARRTQCGGEWVGQSPARFGGSRRQAEFCLARGEVCTRPTCLASGHTSCGQNPRTASLTHPMATRIPERARAQTPRCQVLSSRGGAGGTLHAAAPHWAGAIFNVSAPAPLPPPAWSVSLPPEIPSRVKFDWVKVDQRKIEAREGRSRRAEN